MNKLAQTGYENYYQMLSDNIRMRAYKAAIFNTVHSGDIVVDLGAGTGLLSIWAIQAGAAKVYAIEKTDAIELAKEVARVNHCEEKIEFIQQNSLTANLPEKADVLLSETLGSFAIDENTLLFTQDARERFLKKDGRLIPQSVELFIAPVNNETVYQKLNFWKHIPDIDFSPAFELFSHKIMIETIKKRDILAAPLTLAKIDLRAIHQTQFHSRDYIPINKPGIIHGIAGWFTTQLSPGIKISTAPEQPPTHWKQAFFPFKDKIDVIKGDILDWSMTVGGKTADSDDTFIQYDYRCTQLKNETEKAIGRNAPCPCGSGKKYKKCCLIQ